MDSGCSFIVFVLIVIVVLVGLGLLLDQNMVQHEQISDLTAEVSDWKQRYLVLEKNYTALQKEKEDQQKKFQSQQNEIWALQKQVLGATLACKQEQVQTDLSGIFLEGALLIFVLAMVRVVGGLRHGRGEVPDAPVQPEKVRIVMTKKQLEEFIRWQRGR